MEGVNTIPQNEVMGRRSRKNTTTPAKNIRAIRIPGSRFTSGVVEGYPDPIRYRALGEK
jgi:hypothetical protein